LKSLKNKKEMIDEAFQHFTTRSPNRDQNERVSRTKFVAPINTRKNKDPPSHLATTTANSRTIKPETMPQLPAS
jgi:hypothetical protein